MDGRDEHPIHNPSAYFLQQRGFGGSGFQNVFYGSSGVRSISSAGQNFSLQPGAVVSGGGSGIPGFHNQGESPSSLSLLRHGGFGEQFGSETRVLGGSLQAGKEEIEPLKKKRGRPRKYGPEGKAALPISHGTSPLGSLSRGGGAAAVDSGSGSIDQGQKRRRGRPPGSGKKQQLACYGEWISSSAGGAFTPHSLMISSGEDIHARIQDFFQNAPRAVCIISAAGSVSTVTLRQPNGGTVTYEGLFEILCLSGSYIHSDSGGTHNRSGGLSISLSSPDGRVLGGGVGGQLLASSPVQVIVGSFIFTGSKSKTKTKHVPVVGSENVVLPESQMETPSSTPANQIINPILSAWPGSRQMGMRSSDMDIDLTRG